MKKIETIEDVLLNDIKHTTNQLKDMIDNLKLYLEQAAKVESKPKAYRVKDEYSHNCLVDELEEQGYNVKYARRDGPAEVIYIEEDKTIMGSSLDYYEGYERDNYELIEYHRVEE